jgi:hypothetical protein
VSTSEELDEEAVTKTTSVAKAKGQGKAKDKGKKNTSGRSKSTTASEVEIQGNPSDNNDLSAMFTPSAFLDPCAPSTSASASISTSEIMEIQNDADDYNMAALAEIADTQLRVGSRRTPSPPAFEPFKRQPTSPIDVDRMKKRPIPRLQNSEKDKIEYIAGKPFFDLGCLSDDEDIPMVSPRNNLRPKTNPEKTGMAGKINRRQAGGGVGELKPLSATETFRPMGKRNKKGLD